MNKKITYFLMFMTIAFSYQCKKNSSAATGSQSSTPVTAPAGTADFSDPTWVETSNRIGNGNPTSDLDTMTESRMKHVVNHFWWIDGYVSSREEVRADQRGKWYYFYPNRTFDYGKWNKYLSRGTWKYNPKTETLYTKTDDGKETRQWTTMMSSTNEKFIWMGPPIGPNRGDQAMLQPYLQLPTEKDIFWGVPTVTTKTVEEEVK